MPLKKPRGHTQRNNMCSHNTYPLHIEVTCGPITAEPMAPSGTTTARGALFVPLTEAEKAEKRLIKANSFKNSSSGGSSNSSSGALLVGGGGALKDEEPVTFTHLKTWGRNYAVLQVSRAPSFALWLSPLRGRLDCRRSETVMFPVFAVVARARPVPHGTCLVCHSSNLDDDFMSEFCA